jgi:hypothetical protein
VIVRIHCAISNAYLLMGEKPVLVDTGAPGDLKRILAALKQNGVEPKQLALIILTHGHSSQAGCAAELRRRSGALIALHNGDAALARTGENGVMAGVSPLARVLRPFVDEPFEAFEPDLLFRDGFSSVVLGSGEAIIGDVLRGSMLLPNKARSHYFCNDQELNNRSIVRLAREGLLRCHPGNFGSFPGSELHRFLATSSGEVMALSGEPV